MAELVTCLLCQHKDLSLDPLPPYRKRSVVAELCDKGGAGAVVEIGACLALWPISLLNR